MDLFHDFYWYFLSVILFNDIFPFLWGRCRFIMGLFICKQMYWKRAFFILTLSVHGLLEYSSSPWSVAMQLITEEFVHHIETAICYSMDIYCILTGRLFTIPTSRNWKIIVSNITFEPLTARSWLMPFWKRKCLWKTKKTTFLSFNNFWGCGTKSLFGQIWLKVT